MKRIALQLTMQTREVGRMLTRAYATMSPDRRLQSQFVVTSLGAYEDTINIYTVMASLLILFFLLLAHRCYLSHQSDY